MSRHLSNSRVFLWCNGYISYKNNKESVAVKLKYPSTYNCYGHTMKKNKDNGCEEIKNILENYSADVTAQSLLSTAGPERHK
jgi:hypothetical protein